MEINKQDKFFLESVRGITWIYHVLLLSIVNYICMYLYIYSVKME